MEERVGCGAHGDDAPLPLGFDYTCEDCMIPYTLEHYDNSIDEEGTKTVSNTPKGKPF